ncbi:homoserine kinase [Salisaeta longa]|uniref:homoserine kinase n=1 Tax=Salisaeta longa TaxID=503170 RepID=UPI0003B38A69|nr:homoserine kinase [Salisaeta longa]
MPARAPTRPLQATAAAPASIGNVAVGYDVLGQVLAIGVHDRVTVRRTERPGVRIEAITGATGLPTDPAHNTATAGLLDLCAARDLPHGLAVSIDKGIPLSAGLGGSAASAVAGVWAAGALLDPPLSRDEAFRYALAGEAVASGDWHPDNVAPALYGGLVLTRDMERPDVLRLPVPDGLSCVVAHPTLTINTRDARACVPPTVPIRTATQQMADLGGLVAGCYTNDLPLVGRALRDGLAEPHRERLLPGFAAIKQAALQAGALGGSFAGAGPTMFMWCPAAAAADVAAALQGAMTAAGYAVSTWTSAVDGPGVRCVASPAD